MVSMEGYLGTEEVVPKVLQRKNNCQKFSASCAIILLRFVKNTGKEAMSLSTPFTTWLKTAPTATFEASVSKMHGRSGYGKASVSVASKADFRRSK